MQNMPGMEHMQHEHPDPAMDLLMNQASGTSMNPLSWPMPMLMFRPGSWQLMFMGSAFVVDAQQTGPRGGDKLYSPNWFMLDAGHRAGKGTLMLQLMASLDPLTITNRRYPELFQTGETAYGRSLIDAQHPHDFFMNLGIQYAYPIGDKTVLQAYFAPVGDPALGPVAFPHRASAAEIPQAPIGHHWQDSTHIANEVITAAITHDKLRLEASGFYGREPDESRWNIDHGPIDSWSTRLSIFPARNWMAQVSVGRIARPEVTTPGDVVRATASLHYTQPMGEEAWSTSLIWGRNHNTFDRRDSHSFLVESLVPFGGRNYLTGRIESVGKDELAIAGSYRIGAYTVGYTRDIGTFYKIRTGIGVNVTGYTLPDALRPVYGAHPVGVNVYVRVRNR